MYINPWIFGFIFMIGAVVTMLVFGIRSYKTGKARREAARAAQAAQVAPSVVPNTNNTETYISMPYQDYCFNEK